MVSVVPYQVQLRDLDGFGHLSHIRLLELIEIGRLALYSQLTDVTAVADVDLIMGEAQIRYHAQGAYLDELTIGTVIGGVGQSSLAFEYEIWKETGETVAVARTTCVSFDYVTDRPKPVTTGVRNVTGADALPHPRDLGELPVPGSIRERARAEHLLDAITEGSQA